MTLRVALVSTGYEVLRGATANTNAAWIAQRSVEAGAHVVEVRTVGDDEAEIGAAIREAAARADAVVVTGGLGPTPDDRTREALAAAAGVPLVEDAEALRRVEARFARAGRPFAPAQRRQALVPRGGRALENTEGTASALAVTVGATTVFALPGPPREARATFLAHVVPAWRASGRLEEVASRVLWTAGLPESDVAACLDAAMRASEPTVGTHPDEGEVAVRILARGPRAVARADALVADAVARLGDAVVSHREDERLPHAVVARLAAWGRTLATAESVTGGLCARLLVGVEGASAVFRGGWVTYSDAWKRDALGVDAGLLAREGAVSEATARAMAEGARGRSGADLAVATTGVAGPGPDERGVPEGTAFVALATAEGTTATALCVVAPRRAMQRRVAVAALDAVRRALPRVPRARP